MSKQEKIDKAEELITLAFAEKLINRKSLGSIYKHIHKPRTKINTIDNYNKDLEFVTRHNRKARKTDLTKLKTKRTRIEKKKFNKIEKYNFKKIQGWKKHAANYELIPNDQEDTVDYKFYFHSIKSSIIEKLNQILVEKQSFKYNLSCKAVYSKDITENDERKTVYIKYRASTEQTAILNKGSINDNVDDDLEYLGERLDNPKITGSSYSFDHIEAVYINIVNYTPTRGGSYIELPKQIQDKKACINVQNEDNLCFKYAVLSVLHPVKNSNRPTSYKEFEKNYNFGCLTYPASLEGIKKFERVNNISINVYILRSNKNDYYVDIYQLCEKTLEKHVNILLIEKGDNYHYVGIKDLSKLIGSQINDHGHKVYICDRCQSQFNNEDKLNLHKQICDTVSFQRTIMPNPIKNTLKFVNCHKKVPVDFVIYADFESILPKIDNEPIEEEEDEEEISYTRKTHKHIVSGYAYKIVCTEPKYSKPIVYYRGKDAGVKFIEELLKEQDEIMKTLYEVNKQITLSEIDKVNHKNATKCYLCDGEFTEEDYKVRDHHHLSGVYRGPAHLSCNGKASKQKFIPVLFHNLKNYDGHLILANLPDSIESENINCIAQNQEKYMSFTIKKLRFLDSFQFMAESLSNLTDNLKKSGIDKFKYTTEVFKDKTELMLRKGVYFYEYADCFEVFDEKEIPKYEDFYSSLEDTNISQDDFEHMVNVWNQMKMKTKGDYHDLYLKSDVLLLTDIFENFRSFCIKTYSLDPAHYYTLPGFAWDALLKMSKVELELLSDVDKFQFFEASKRGGISVITTQYAKSNNPYLPWDDEKNWTRYSMDEEHSYIIYLDMNNLYGCAMTYKLPVSNFEWIDVNEIDENFILGLDKDLEKGYVFEVDLEYPHELHDLHNDYPLCAETIKVTDDMLSPFSKKQMEQFNIKVGNVSKLVPNLMDKKNYVIHYLALKQALELGLKLKKVHRALSFKQEAWMKGFIEFNTVMRSKAQNDFEKNMFKLMNNSVFGKTMENVRGRIDFKLKTNPKSAQKLFNKPNFKSHTIFNKNLIGIHMTKTEIVLDKPIYVGTSVLDISKILMYDFHYNVMKNKYGNKAVLLATDTDSLMYHVKTWNIYHDMKNDSQLYDFSDYSKDHICSQQKRPPSC